jgi:hypothetical protein
MSSPAALGPSRTTHEPPPTRRSHGAPSDTHQRDRLGPLAAVLHLLALDEALHHHTGGQHGCRRGDGLRIQRVDVLACNTTCNRRLSVRVRVGSEHPIGVSMGSLRCERLLTRGQHVRVADRVTARAGQRVVAVECRGQSTQLVVLHHLACIQQPPAECRLVMAMLLGLGRLHRGGRWRGGVPRAAMDEQPAFLCPTEYSVGYRKAG